jgi:hypothetical protein
MMRCLLLLPFLACKAASNNTAPTSASDVAEATVAEDSENSPPPGVKVSGNLPVRTEAELAAEGAARNECIQACVKSRQMEAVAIEMIEESCSQGCMEEHPIMQVEVAPEAPRDLDSQ